jgi:peptidoglycan/LPS O-acetylase OafA/YrhL
MNFRVDINALRSIAILSVVFYHFKIPYVTGGFVGVDIFFVISGYLMTKIIIKKKIMDEFSLIDFYIDRIYRILPALLFLIFCLFVFGWFFLYPLEFERLAKESVSAILFISNILFHSQNGYFDANTDEIFLLHTWSLSVEWQFYMLYPLLIIFLVKVFSLKRLRLGLVVAFLMSLVYSIYLSFEDPMKGFYLLPSRSWEMLVGGLIYLYPMSKKLSPSLSSSLQIFSMVLMLISILYIDSSFPWPGYWALLPVSATVLFLISNFQTSVFVKSPIFQFLGTSSYSIYLWHWPVFIVLNMYGFMEENAFKILGVLLSILLGFISNKFIESIFLAFKIKNKRNKQSLYMSAVLMFLFVIPVWGVYKLDGVTSDVRSINQDERSVFIQYYNNLQQDGLDDEYLVKCDFYNTKTNKSKVIIPDSCVNNSLINAGGSKSVFLWGDSHAQALSYGLRNTLSKEFRFNQVATSGCSPSFGANNIGSNIDNNCELSNKYAISSISKLKPEVVIIAQREHHELVDWVSIATLLKDLGVKEIVLIGPIPQFKPSLPAIYARYGWVDKANFLSQGLDNDILLTDKAIKDKYKSLGGTFSVVSLFDLLCEADKCRVVTEDGSRNLMLVDYGHLSPEGSLFIADKVIIKLTKDGIL